MKIRLHLLLLLILIPVWSSTGSQEQIRLIEGDRTDYRIIIASDASPTEVFAAQELQGYVAQVTGVFLPMDQGSVQDAKKRILVGSGAMAGLGLEVDKDELGPDGFVIKTFGDKIILAGGSPRGTLYSVYAFLEIIGCRWLALGIIGEVIPQVPTLIITPTAHSERPALAYRGFTNSIPVYHEGVQWIDWMGKNRMNYLMIPLSNYADFKAVVGGEIEKRGMDIGVRFEGFASGDSQLSADHILEFINDNPEIDIIELHPQLLDMETSSEPYAESIAKIAEAVQKQYPDKAVSIMISGGAVSDTGYSILDAQRPGIQDLASSIQHPALRKCYRHSLGDEHCHLNSEAGSYIGNHMEGWDKSHIYEHYMGSYDQNSLLFPILNTISSDLKYLQELEGVSGVISQCEPGNWGTYGLNYYIFARMAWDPGYDLEGIVDDYCKKYFGSASGPMKKYFTALENAMIATEHFHYIEPPHLILKLLDEKTLEDLAINIQNAASLADGAMIFDRIRKTQLSLEHAKLLWYMLHYYSNAVQSQKTGENKEARDYFQKSIEMGEKLIAFLFQNIDEGVFVIPENYIFEYLEPLVADARDRKESLENKE